MKLKYYNYIINKFIKNKREAIWIAEQDNHKRTVETPNLYKIKNLGEKNIRGQKCKISKIQDTGGVSFVEIKNYNFGI